MGRSSISASMPGSLAKYATCLICVTSLAFALEFPMKDNTAEDSSNEKTISRKHTKRRKVSSPPRVGVLLFLVGACCSLPSSESTNVYFISMWTRFEVECIVVVSTRHVSAE